MSIAARFEAALAGVTDPALAGPELLPVRLSRAAVDVLGVDGAGISFVDTTGRRVPLGTSSEEVAAVERLQFTVGVAPCLTALRTREPVFAMEEDLLRRWPVFADLLFRTTRFRAVVAVPVQPLLTGAAAVDLYLVRSERVPQLDVFDALSVGDLVASALSDATVWSTWTPEQGPDWLRGPAPRRRAAVWRAVGQVSAYLQVDSPAALQLMRAHASGTDRSVDDVAADLLLSRLRPEDLRGAADNFR